MTTPDVSPVTTRHRLKLTLRGAVQGVGFRPFVYRLANELSLLGWVHNSPQGVFIEVEGDRPTLEQFRSRLTTGNPPPSFIQSCEASWLDPVGYDGFVIRDSEVGGSKTALVLPDIATCPDCLREINDPTNRRHRYPFTNCTHCGPRFSIIEALPYDRANTSMRGFKMCPACQAEYDNPGDRRFHAQPNACPVCGPKLKLWSGDALADSNETPRSLAQDNDALLAAAHVIRCGQIVAVKGIGGFHLMVDARNEAAVQRLRQRKHREEKPFALMFPTMASVKEVCEVSPLEERLLCSTEAPIVLLKRRIGEVLEQGSDERQNPVGPATPLLQHSSTPCVAPSTAPGNPCLGVMLPSNPLHHLLMVELGFPVVATSGNLSDEPICTDEFEALDRLRGIADVFLVHDRPIVRHVDDSIVRVMLDREMVVRRARGYAPLPVIVAAGILPAVEPGFQPGGISVGIFKSSEISNATCNASAHPGGKMPPSTAGRMPAATILAVGAHLKNSVALAVDGQVFLSQHIGDLETEPANNAFRRVAADLPRLYDVQPEIIAADLHPDYLSTQFALERQLPARRDYASDHSAVPEAGAPQVIQVQHHIAHVLSCMAENEVELPALGVAWDGTGLGTDGTIWGGEFFLVTPDRVERVAHLRPFRLPGGDAAAKEPRRAALGLLHELADRDDQLWSHMQQSLGKAFSSNELALLQSALQRHMNCPLTSSVGRLFDVVASLIGLRQQMHYEGQAAMELEFATEGIVTDKAYELPIADGSSSMQLDWAPMIKGILSDVAVGVPVGHISAKFHNTLGEAVVTVASCLGEQRVVLSGGCFQNRYLTERTVTRLRTAGFQPYWHQRVPTNDGGIALGQVIAARRELKQLTSVFESPSPGLSATLSPSDGERDGVRGGSLQLITQHASL